MNRAAEIGQLAASLAHELAQPLAAVLSNAQAASRLAMSKPLDLDEIKSALADIIEDDQRACAVLNNMRSILGKHTVAPHEVNLNEIVEDAILLVRSSALMRGIHLEAVLSPKPVLVQGDEIPLQQVLLNLIINAMDAMAQSSGETKVLTVRTSVQNGDAHGLLVVEDEGTGIPEELRARLFTPFFTTKKEGLGMGLAICCTILTNLGGTIDFQNRPERGAAFRVALPLALGDRATSEFCNPRERPMPTTFRQHLFGGAIP
jgi:C4-dicarboxylate-specific signal transduction histidine kinase